MTDEADPTDLSVGEEAGEYTAIAAGLIPLFGGAISDLAQKLIRDRQSKRIGEFLAKLQGEVEQIKGRLNDEFLRKDEAKQLFEEVLLGVEQTTRPEQLDALVNILVVSYTAKSPSYNKATEVLHLVRELRPLQFRFLKILADPVAANVRAGNPVPPPGSFPWTSINEILKRLMPDLQREEIELTWQSLLAEQLVNTPGTMTTITDRGIAQLENRLTHLGVEVVGYLFGK